MQPGIDELVDAIRVYPWSESKTWGIILIIEFTVATSYTSLPYSVAVMQQLILAVMVKNAKIIACQICYMPNPKCAQYTIYSNPVKNICHF